MKHFQQEIVKMDETEFRIKIFGIWLPSNLKSFF